LLAELGTLSSQGALTVQDVGLLGPLVELEFGRSVNPSQFRMVKSNSPSALGIAEALEVGRKSGHRADDYFGLLPIPNETPAVADSESLSQWALRFRTSAIRRGCPTLFASALAAVLGELIDNVGEHAGSPSMALAGFRVEPGTVEIVVYDAGFGALSRLRENPRYSALPDAAAALRAIVFDHATRHSDESNHGHGVRQIFRTLAGREGTLRFRSEDHSLELGDGGFIESGRLESRSEARLPGFGVSVLCRLPPTGR
jgi:hypothetical protein